MIAECEAQIDPVKVPYYSETPQLICNLDTLFTSYL